MKEKSKKNKNKTLLIYAVSIAVAFAIVTYVLLVSPLNAGGKKFSIYISTNNNAAEVEQKILDSLYRDAKSPSIVYFKWKITSLIKATDHFPPGKYTLDGDLSAKSIFNKILSGNQDAVSIRIDNIKTIYKLAARFAKYFEQDSAQFMTFVNQNLDALAPGTKELTTEIRQQRVLEKMLGNTYEMYWTSSPENFFSRVNSIYESYWTVEKDTLARRLGYTPHEVYVLASIVRGETSNKEEAPTIAGLYMNRLKKDMLLQSDPTVLFGINTKEKRQRVRNSDLKFDSPYNTYLYKGLPPAAIHIVEETYLEAVLKPEVHNYIFMCAQPGKTGKHNFAIDYSAHQINAKNYRDYLDSLDIQR